MATKKTVGVRTAKAIDETTHAAAEQAFSFGNAFTGAAQDQYEKLFSAFNTNAEEMRGVSEEMLSAMRSSFEAAQGRMQELGSEAMNAARDDMKEAVDFANDLARAKTVLDALEIQRNYWSRFFETRMERTRTMTQTSIEAARESLDPISKSFSSAFAAAPAFDKLFAFPTK